MKKFNLRKKILALALTAITMFSTITGILPGSIVHAAGATSGTYYGINWDMDAEGNLTIHSGTCTNTQGTKWNSTGVKTVKCDGNIICNNKFCERLFYDHRNLVSADVSGFDTRNVTTMQLMFGICENLTALDVSNFNTRRVKNMSYMFSHCSELTSLNVSNFDTSNVTTMYNMFFCCRKLTSLDVSNFNTSNVTEMGGMFDECSSLTSLDVSNFNTSKVKTMNSMFYACTGLTSLDVSNFNTSKVTYMGGMFDDCTGLTSLDLSNFNTSNVTDMKLMFAGCTGLTSLDLSSFDTGNVKYTERMFQNCNKLEVLTTPKVIGATDITLPFTMYDDSNISYDKLVGNNVVLYHRNIYYGIEWELDTDGNLILKGGTCTNTTGTKWNATDVKTVKCDGEIVCNNNFCTQLFQDNTNLVSADLSGFNTSNVTYMGNMFKYCKSLMSLDLSSFDTSNVTSMINMFGGCSSLTSLDLSSFNTDKVINMSGMFYFCSSLMLLDLSNFDTSNVTNASGMLSGCSKLEVLTTPKTVGTTNITLPFTIMYDNSNNPYYNLVGNNIVLYHKYIYYGIEGQLDADGNLTLKSGTCTGTRGTKWNDTDVKTVKCSGEIICNNNFCQGLFKKHSNLVSADLSGFNTSNVTDISEMFSGCSSLKSLDLSSFDTSTCHISYSFISNAKSLELLKTPKVKPQDAYRIVLPYRMYDNENKKYYDALDVENVTLQKEPTYTKEETVEHTLEFNDGLFNIQMQLNGTPNDVFADDEDFLKNTSAFRLLDETSDNYGNCKYNHLNYVVTEQGKEFVFSSLKPYISEDELNTLKQNTVVVNESDIKIDYITEIIDENGSVIQTLPEGKCYIQVTINYNGVEYKSFVNPNGDPEVFNLLPNNIGSTTTDSIEASYDENNNLVVKANQTDTYTSGKKVTKTVDIDTYGVTDQGTTLLITYDGASTEIEKIVNIEGTLLYNDGTPVQRKVVKLSTPKDMFDLSSDEGHYEFLNVSLTNNTMPLSVFDTDDTSACSDDILLTSGVVTFDNTGAPVLDNDPSKDMTLVIEKVTPTVPEREEVVVPTPEVVPTPNPSNTTTVVVPEPITDNTNSVVPNSAVNNADVINLSNIVATASGKTIQSDVTKVGNTVNKNIYSEKSKQNDEKITDFSKNSDKDNKKIDANNKKPSEEKDTTANSIKENKSSQNDADMIMGISFLLVLIIVAIIVVIIRSKSKKEQ